MYGYLMPKRCGHPVENAGGVGDGHAVVGDRYAVAVYGLHPVP